MRRSLLALALAFVLLLGSSAAAAPTQPPKLVVVLNGCNESVAVTEKEGGTLAFSGSRDAYAYSVGAPVNGVTTVRITQRPDRDNYDVQTLTVPAGVYRVIRVELKGFAAALRPLMADYEVDGRDSALSILLPSTYVGKVSGRIEDSAVALSVSEEAKNLSVSIGIDDCAVSAPDTWDDQNGRRLTFSRGTGGARLELTAEDCSLSVEERAPGYDSLFEGKSTAASMSVSSDNLEMLIGEVWGTGWSGSDFSKWRAASKPNTLTEIGTVPTKGITGLRVNADLCALVLERSGSGKIELAYQGVENAKTIAVTTAVKDGLLTITAQGTIQDTLYLSAAANRRVNCVRVRVPEGLLKSLTVDCGDGIIAANGLALPTVTGGATRGVIALKTGVVSAPITLSAENGSLMVTANTVSASVALNTSNGCAEVDAGTVSGGVALTTRNGTVELDADDATGKLTLTARNGCVDADVKRVKDAEFRAENGNVDVAIGTVTGNTVCAVTNGTLEVELTKRPKDLSFHIEGGWNDSTRNGWGDDDWDDDDSGLPSGWYDGLVLGNGKPSLTLSAAVNGRLCLDAPSV